MQKAKYFKPSFLSRDLLRQLCISIMIIRSCKGQTCGTDRGTWPNCQDCPKGSFGLTPEDECLSCGDYIVFSTTEFAGATSDSNCTCEPGYYFDVNEYVCVDCLGGANEIPGSYKSTYGLEECTLCPGTMTTAGFAATSLSDCMCGAGYTHNSTNPNDPCVYCPDNHYKEYSGNAQCTACPAGRTNIAATNVLSLRTSRKDCVCPAGSALLDDPPSYPCGICEAGKYKSATSSNFESDGATFLICQDMSTNTCPSGEGFSSPSADPSDFSGATVNDGTCTSCPVGKYKSTSGPTACVSMSVTSCPPGEGFSSASAGVDLQGADADDGTCTYCPAGKYKSTSGMFACTDMNVSSCSAGEGFASASATGPLLSGSTVNDGECTLCLQGQYKETSGAAACNTMSVTSCPSGSGFKSVSAGGDLVGATANDGACTSCPVAKYKADSDGPLAACSDMTVTTCSAGFGFISTSAGADLIGATANDGVCVECPAGKFKASSGASACDSMTVSSCSAGSGFNSISAGGDLIGATANDGDCIECPTGKFKVTSGAAACDDMTIGTCSAGSGFSSLSANTDLQGATSDDGNCTSCPAGYFKESTGAAACIEMSHPASSSCDPGKGFDSDSAPDKTTLTGSTQNDGTCTKCPLGKYAALSNPNSPCIELSADEDVQCAPGEGFVNKDRGCKLSKPEDYGSDQFKRQAWFMGCELRKSDVSACKLACESGAGGCCEPSMTREAMRCSSNACMSGGTPTCTCSEAEQICKLACEQYFNPVPVFPGALARAVATDDGTCVLCPAGTYQENAGQSNCIKMSACNSSSLSASGCTEACGVGSGLLSPSASGGGGTGATSDDGACVLCGAGFFNAASDASPCIEMSEPGGKASCPKGKGFSSASSQTADNQGSTTNDGQCTSCAAGQNQHLDASTSACATCPAGRASVDASTTCATCATGTFQESSPATTYGCKTCAPGAEYVNNTTPCQQCENGQYQTTNSVSNGDIQSCQTCGKGQVSGGASLSCSACPDGKYQELDVADSYTCKTCPAGREFVSKNDTCALCPLGKVQTSSSEAGVTCQWCPAGKGYVSSTQDCETCAHGQYQDTNTGEGGTRRSRALRKSWASHGLSRGSRSLATAIQTCKMCSAGKKFSSVSQPCQTCDAGKYQDSNTMAPAVCSTCPSGRFLLDTSNNASKHDSVQDCLLCAAGTEFTSASSGCATCGAGKFQDSDIAAPALCYSCPNGRFLLDSTDNPSKHDSVQDCLNCTVGTEFTSATTACATCGAGKYQTQNTASPASCVNCPQGRYLLDIASDPMLHSDIAQCLYCQNGTEFTSIQTVCTVCPAGRYQPGPSHDVVPASCTQCPTGRYLLDPKTNAALHVDVTQCLFCAAGTEYTSGTSACTQCTSGQFQNSNNTASAVCHTCNKGMFSASRTEACQNCPDGKFSDRVSNNKYDCDFCAAGKSYTSATQPCSDCEPGKYQPSDASLSPTCEMCPSGKYQSQSRQVDCNSMTYSSCNPGYGFSSPSALEQTNITGSLSNDGSCAICPAGFWKASSELQGRCLQMTEPEGKHKCPVGQGFSSASVQTAELEGSIFNDGACESCQPPHEYSAFDDASACYLYTCQVSGNRCASGYKCCEKNGQRCIPNSADCNTIGTDQDPGATDAACDEASGFKRCESAGDKCLKTDGTEPCLCPAGTFKAPGSTLCQPMTSNPTCPPGQRFKSSSAEDQVFMTGSSVDDGQCEPCAAGKVKPSDSAGQCTFCPRGYSYPGNASTSCHACQPGYFQSSASTAFATCKACAPGQFVSGFAASICGIMSQSDCGAGREFSSPSATVVKKPSWKYSKKGSTDNDGVCTLCPSAKFRRDRWPPWSVCQNMIVSCSRGMGYSSASALDQTTLTGSTSEDGVCASCPEDTFKDSTLPTNCTHCPPTATTGGAVGSDEAEDCICMIGHYLADVGNSSFECTKCPLNTYKSVAGNARISGCTPCPSGSYTAPGTSGATSMMSCYCEAPTFSSTFGDGETSVALSSPTDGAHICVVYAPVLADLGIGGNGAHQTGGCGSPSPSNVKCTSPMQLYTGSIRITETMEFSALTCRNGEMTPSTRVYKKFGIGLKPTISKSGGTQEGGIGDTYTITSTDPNPDDTICVSVTPLGSSQNAGSLCDGFTGNGSSAADVMEFVPGISEDIALHVSSVIRAIVCIPNHAPSAVSSLSVELTAKKPLLGARKHSVYPGRAVITSDLDEASNTSYAGGGKLCYRVNLRETSFKRVAACAAPLVAGAGSDECGAGSLAYPVIQNDGATQTQIDELLPSISETAIVSAVKCQAGRQPSPTFTLQVNVLPKPNISIAENPLPRLYDTGVVAKVMCPNATTDIFGSMQSISTMCCLRNLEYGTDVDSAHSETVAQCADNGNTTQFMCGTGSFPVVSSFARSRYGWKSIFSSTTLSVLTCPVISNGRRRLNTDLTQIDTTVFISSHIASENIRFKSTPKITSNSPQRGSVDVSISSDDIDKDSGGIFCYIVTKTLDSNLLAPTCGFSDDGDPKCNAPSQQFKSIIKVMSSAYVVAIGCESSAEESAPSNRTALWIDVLPAKRDNATAGGVGIDDDDENENENDDGNDANTKSSDKEGLLSWWIWLIIALLICCCCLFIILCLFCLKKRREPKRRRAGGGAGGNLDYTLKLSNPMRLPTAALAAGDAAPEYSPRTKISMMSRLGSKPMVALKEAHHVELSNMRETPRPGGFDSSKRKRASKKRDTSLSGLSAIPETLTSGKDLPAPTPKSEKLAAPPPNLPPAPLLVPKTPGNSKSSTNGF